MALKDSYKLIHQMAADSYEAEMMKDPEFRAQMEQAQQQDEALKQPSVWHEPAQSFVAQPTPWEEFKKEYAEYFPPEPSQDMER